MLCSFVYYEASVELENVNLHRAKHIKRGIAASEVVHLNDKAFAMQNLHGADNLPWIVRICRLCNLKMKQRWVYFVLINQSDQSIYKIALEEVCP